MIVDNDNIIRWMLILIYCVFKQQHLYVPVLPIQDAVSQLMSNKYSTDQTNSKMALS